MKREESSLTNLTKLFVLSLLRTPNHGYGLMKVFEARTDKRLSPGQLYPLLRRMERKGLLQSKSIYNGKRRRKVYSLTDLGKRTQSDLQKRLKDVIG